MTNHQVDMESGTRVEVLFVCMGNMCRSPTAQGVFRKLLETKGLGAVIGTDSAGTHACHTGEPPDDGPRRQPGRARIKLYRNKTVAQADEFAGVDHDFYEEVGKDHGRLETRRYWITEELRPPQYGASESHAF